MEKETKTSDAVTITKIAVPVALIIALALIFKNEIAGLMNRGCFELSIEQAGIGIGDKSMCTSSDLEKMADSLLMAGARVAEEQAAKSFSAYDSLIDELETKYAESVHNLNEKIAELNKRNAANKTFHAELVRAGNIAVSAETKNAMRKLTVRFQQLNGNEFTSTNLVKSVSTEINEQQRAIIRKDFIDKSTHNIEQIQDNVKVKRTAR